MFDKSLLLKLKKSEGFLPTSEKLEKISKSSTYWSTFSLHKLI